MSALGQPGSALDRVTDALCQCGSRQEPGGNWNCPAHEDQSPSLSVGPSTNRKKPGVVIHCHAGCTTDEVLSALGLKFEHLFDDYDPDRKRTDDTTAEYDYTDDQGNLLYQVLRKPGKRFTQRRPDGSGGWTWGLGDTQRVPYRLPEVVDAVEAGETVYVVEGEKDVEAIRDAGAVATCNSGGAEKWKSTHAEHLRGATVVVIADKDEPGRKHAAQVEASLKDVAASVTVVEAVEGKDAHDALVKHGLSIEEAFETRQCEEEKQVEQDRKGSGRFIGENDKGKSFVKMVDLARHIRNEWHMRPSIDGRFYRYVDGVYRSDGEDFIGEIARIESDFLFRKSILNEVCSWIKTYQKDLPELPPTDWLNFANGLYDWKTGKLDPHSPEFLSAIQYPVAYRPDARCPEIEKFLIQAVGEEALPFIYELIGYLLYPGNPFRKAILLFGFGLNGKTVLLSILTAILGPENISTVPLQTLSENRFATADLYGKVANICGDLDARAIKQTDQFKMITGGDAVRAERKFKDGFSFHPFAVPVFSANEVPLSSDQSTGWFDRWIVIPFKNRVAEEDVDPHLTAKLTSPAELEGLLVKALEGLRRVMERGRFEEPPSVKAAGEGYRDRVDSVRGFITEECELGPTVWSPRAGLYRAYRIWCEESGRCAVSRQSFNDHIRQNYGDRIVQKTVNGNRRWAGIGHPNAR